MELHQLGFPNTAAEQTLGADESVQEDSGPSPPDSKAPGGRPAALWYNRNHVGIWGLSPVGEVLT